MRSSPSNSFAKLGLESGQPLQIKRYDHLRDSRGLSRLSRGSGAPDGSRLEILDSWLTRGLCQRCSSLHLLSPTLRRSEAEQSAETGPAEILVVLVSLLKRPARHKWSTRRRRTVLAGTITSCQVTESLSSRLGISWRKSRKTLQVLKGRAV